MDWLDLHRLSPTLKGKGLELIDCKLDIYRGPICDVSFLPHTLVITLQWFAKMQSEAEGIMQTSMQEVAELEISMLGHQVFSYQDSIFIGESNRPLGDSYQIFPEGMTWRKIL